MNATTGSVRWQTTIEGLPQPDPGVTAFAPLLVDDVVAIPVSGTEDDVPDKIIGLDASSGDRRWAYPLGASLSGAPAASGNRLVLPRVDGVLECIDHTGQRQWTITTPSPLSAATVESGTVYVGSVNECLSAYAIESGSERWCLQTENAVLTKPRVVGETVYVGAADYYVYAATTSGKRRWRTETQNAVTSGPVPVSDALVTLVGGQYNDRGQGNRVPFRPEIVYVHGRENGRQRRAYEFEGFQEGGQPQWVAKMGGDVYLAQEYQLHKLDGETFHD